jgi:hypothetical protein
MADWLSVHQPRNLQQDKDKCHAVLILHIATPVITNGQVLVVCNFAQSKKPYAVKLIFVLYVPYVKVGRGTSFLD